LEAWFNGHSPDKIAELAGYTQPPPVKSWLRQPKYQDFVDILRQAYSLQTGPTIAQRKELLWHIALDNYEDKPAVAIRAVDVLNRMDQPDLMVTPMVDLKAATDLYHNIKWELLAHVPDVEEKVISEVPPT
jgi:hypothetical protein